MAYNTDMAILFATNEDAGELRDVISSAQSPHLYLFPKILS